MGGHRVTIAFDSRSKTARVKTESAAAVTYFESFLDELKASYPEASVDKAPRKVLSAYTTQGQAPTAGPLSLGV